MPGRGETEPARVAVEDTKKQAHKTLQLLLYEQSVGALQHLLGFALIVSEGVDHVLDEGRGARRADAMTGDIADEHDDPGVPHRKHVVEVAPHECRFGGGAVQVPEPDSADLCGDVEKGKLEGLRYLLLGPVEPGVLLGRLALSRLAGPQRAP